MRQGAVISLLTLTVLFSGGMIHTVNSATISKNNEVKMNPQRFVLQSNGLTVLLLNRPTLPIVTVKMMVRSGAMYDDPQRGGVASIVADLLTEGTTTRTSQQISEQIDFLGGSLGSTGGREFISGSLKVLKKDVDKGFELLADIMINPSFPQAEIDRTKTEIKNGIIAERDEPSRVVQKEFDKLLFGSHPYSRPVSGTVKSVEKITRQEILDFYNRYYAPNNAIMAIVGDLTVEEAKQLLNNHFAKWVKKDLLLPKIETVSWDRKLVTVVDKDLTQANIMLGHLGISRKNPDFYPLILMNFMLGSGSTSRLYQNIREKSGLVYSVGSYFSAKTYAGSFVVSLQTKNSTAQEAVKRVIREIKRIRTEKVAEEELADAKAYITGSFPLRIDTNSETANLLAFIEYYDLGLDYFNMYRKKIEAVDTEEILRVAKQYLDPENYLLVVVGNKKEVGDFKD